MQRKVAEVEAHYAAPRELPPALVRLITDYHCRFLTAAEMERVRPLLHAVFAASAITAEDTMRDYRTHVAALAGYALQRGRPLTPAGVLTTAFIDEYVRVGMAGEEDKLKGRRRSILLTFATQANPGPTAPAKLTPIPHSSVRPPTGRRSSLSSSGSAAGSPPRARAVTCPRSSAWAPAPGWTASTSVASDSRTSST